MYTPYVDISDMLTSPSSFVPLDRPSHFSLGTSGVVGLVGGDDAVSAMTAVHVYGNRRWLGWYNAPGSFQIAKRIYSFAKSASLHSIPIFGGNFSQKGGISKGVDADPMALSQLNACKGPKFRAAHSGTIIEETSYLAALFMKECSTWDLEGKAVPGRKTQPVGITIAELSHTPAPELHPAHSHATTILSASIPITVSIGACALCALCGDWYASLLILVGIIASGVFSFILGSADFVFVHPEPAKGSPAGDGILTSDKDIVLLKGAEGAVNSITRGRFSLRFRSQEQYSLVRWCSFLFFFQFITQLLLIPQASLFGQVMFLTSLGVSGLYNAWLSSLDKEKIHQRLLFERVLRNPTLTKYTLGTRTSAVVFMLLVLQLQDPTALLDELLPNDTKVWKQWKTAILEQLRRPSDRSFLFKGKVGDLSGFTQPEKDLLELLYEDARAAYNGYMEHLRV